MKLTLTEDQLSHIQRELSGLAAETRNYAKSPEKRLHIAEGIAMHLSRYLKDLQSLQNHHQAPPAHSSHPAID